MQMATKSAGIKSPLLMAPLGTYIGWNVISTGMFKGQLCHNNGTGVAGFIPFALTRAERLAAAIRGSLWRSDTRRTTGM